ncbi:MAG TPA: YafY family protein, partial [Anaerolineaceae bacterium]|nr:YafY family protein [Anaerolineaceae bacterium]
MRADRLMALLLRLQSRGTLTAQDLAEEMDVSERTIYRDVEALSLAGIPVYTQPGIHGGITLDENYRLALTGLSRSEVQALFIANEPGPLRDLGMASAISETLVKLLSALPNTQRDQAEYIRQRVYIDPMDWFKQSEPMPYLAALQQAVWEDRVARAVYLRPDGKSSERVLRPLALVAKSTVWYLVAQQADGEMRTFRVSRFQRIDLTQERFVRPADFDLPTYWPQASRSFVHQVMEGMQPYPAVVRVAPQEVRFFINDLEGHYTRLERDDPQGWTHLHVTFPSFGGARMRVLSLGDQIEVLEPQ